MRSLVILLGAFGSLSAARTSQDTAAALLPRILSGSDSDFLDLFVPDGTGSINDVFAGEIGGSSTALLAFRSSFVARLAPVRPVRTSLQTLRVTRDATAPRVAVEQILPLAAGVAWDACTLVGKTNSSAELLFTVVAEQSAAGRLQAVRLYYASYPITGTGVSRPPILPHNASAVTSGAVAAYQSALHAGDAVAVASNFEPDGYFREPSGTYHPGALSGVLSNFRSFFELGHGGGILLEHTAVTSDGGAYVLEYNCIGWGGVSLPPAAGVATYELGRGSRIMGARVNDNVQPPPPAHTYKFNIL